jgi:hypothetical protein
MSLAKSKYQIPEILTAGEDDSSEYVDLHYSVEFSLLCRDEGSFRLSPLRRLLWRLPWPMVAHYISPVADRSGYTKYCPKRGWRKGRSLKGNG